MKRYKLKLTSLKFISPVDSPAQETATTLLIKRADGAAKGFARVCKVDDELGLVFCWAFTSKVAGADYHDLHGDAIDEADIIKVAAEFMEGARAVDEMHDGVQTGSVVFAMPMTAEVAKAFGVTTDTTGLMCAIKPAPDVFAKFKSGEYTGVSIEGTGIREQVSLHKRAALTTAVSGHTHMLYAVDETTSGSTSYESLPAIGDSYGRGHSHPWIKNDDGSITIGVAENHTHDVASMSSTEKRAPQPAQNGNSTTAGPGPNVTDMDEIASLKKQLAAALVLAAMTDVQKGHRATLIGGDVEAFDALTPAGRDAAVTVAKAADPVIYTCTDGTEIRKSQGDLMHRLAKSADEANKLAKSERDQRETVEFQKRADTVLKHFGKPVAVRAAILKSIDGIADEPTRKEALEALAGADAACAELAKAQGVNPGGDPAATGGNPIDVFNKARDAFAAKHAITDPNLATEKFLGTPEGLVAKRAYDAHHPSNAARN